MKWDIIKQKKNIFQEKFISPGIFTREIDVNYVPAFNPNEIQIIGETININCQRLNINADEIYINNILYTRK